MKYRVTLRVDELTFKYTVEADSKADAEERALDEAYVDGLAREVEAEVLEVVDLSE